MFYLQNLRIRLQEKRNRLYRCDHRTYPSELGYLIQFLDENPYLKGLLNAMEAEETAEFDIWVESAFSRSEAIRFPKTEAGRAKMCLGIIKQCANDQRYNQLFHWGRQLGGDLNLNEVCASITENAVDPLINFLHDRIEEAGNVLFVMERFKRKTEWFSRRDLFQQYVENTSAGETHLDQALRLGLFEGGIDYPFSQPDSPSGKADVVALLGSDDPLVLEVKVFDPARNRNVRHLQQGFHQILRYADDYNQNVGYLVIFNCSDGRLVVADGASEDTESPSRIVYANKTFFVFVIDVNPHTSSASKENPSKRHVINHRVLVDMTQDRA